MEATSIISANMHQAAQLIRSFKPKEFGVIIRTVAADRDDKTLKKDMDGLLASTEMTYKSLNGPPWRCPAGHRERGEEGPHRPCIDRMLRPAR